MSVPFCRWGTMQKTAYFYKITAGTGEIKAEDSLYQTHKKEDSNNDGTVTLNEYLENVEARCWRVPLDNGQAEAEGAAKKQARREKGESAAAAGTEIGRQLKKKMNLPQLEQLHSLASNNYEPLVETARSSTDPKLKIYALFMISLIDGASVLDDGSGELRNVAVYLDAVADPNPKVAAQAKKILRNFRYDAEKGLIEYLRPAHRPKAARQFAANLLENVWQRKKTAPVVVEYVCDTGLTGRAKPKYDFEYLAQIRLLGLPELARPAEFAELKIIDPQTGRHWRQAEWGSTWDKKTNRSEFTGLRTFHVWIDKRNPAVQAYIRFTDRERSDCADKGCTVGRSTFTIIPGNNMCFGPLEDFNKGLNPHGR